MEDTQKQFKKLKANYTKLVKSEASSSEILDRLKNDLEKAREAKRLQEQKVEQQNLMINTLQQLVRLRFLFLHIYIDIILHALIVTCNLFNIHMHTYKESERTTVSS